MFTKKFFAMFLSVNAFALAVLPQTQNEAKTFTEDELEAARVARAFARELERTKDLGRLLPRYGTPKYANWVPKAEWSIEREFAAEELLQKIEPSLVRRLHVAIFNWFYLNSIWSLHQRTIDDELPPAVASIFKADPKLSRLFHTGIDTKPLSTKRQLVNMIERLERAAVLYRGYLKRFPKHKSATYLKNMPKYEVWNGSAFQPETFECDEEFECFGRPIGSKSVQLLINPFCMVFLVKSGNAMKIAYVSPNMH